jgi:hypothetical protein
MSNNTIQTPEFICLWGKYLYTPDKKFEKEGRYSCTMDMNEESYKKYLEQLTIAVGEKAAKSIFAKEVNGRFHIKIGCKASFQNGQQTISNQPKIYGLNGELTTANLEGAICKATIEPKFFASYGKLSQILKSVRVCQEFVEIKTKEQVEAEIWGSPKTKDTLDLSISSE